MKKNGQFWSIGIFLWHRNHPHINIYWHPWFGAIFSSLGYLEVSFVDKSFVVLRMSWKEPAPLKKSSFLQSRIMSPFINQMWTQKYRRNMDLRHPKYEINKIFHSLWCLLCTVLSTVFHTKYMIQIVTLMVCFSQCVSSSVFGQSFFFPREQLRHPPPPLQKDAQH